MPQDLNHENASWIWMNCHRSVNPDLFISRKSLFMTCSSFLFQPLPTLPSTSHQTLTFLCVKGADRLRQVMNWGPIGNADYWWLERWVSSISQLKSDAIQPLLQDLKNKTKHNFSLKTRCCTRLHLKSKRLSHGPTARTVLLLTSNLRDGSRTETHLSILLSARKHTRRLAKQLGSSLVLSRLWEYGGKDNMCAFVCATHTKQTGRFKGYVEGREGRGWVRRSINIRNLFRGSKTLK